MRKAAHSNNCRGSKTDSTARQKAEPAVGHSGDLAQQNVGNLAIQQYFIQPKLAISNPDDPYEKEADAVATQVLRKLVDDNPIQISSVSPGVHRECTKCVGEPQQAERSIQRKTGQNSASEDRVSAGSVAAATQAGRLLDKNTRRFFEPRFGRSFGNVKVHTGGYSNQVAQALSAKAFTTGSDIVFAQGQYRPESVDGKRLLAHELTHVIQQSGSVPAATNNNLKGVVGSQSEQGEAAVRKQPIPAPTLTRKRSAHIQRKTENDALAGADGVTESVSHAGHMLTENGAQLMGVLEKITIKQGLSGTKKFVEKFAGSVSSPPPKRTGGGGAGGGGGTETQTGTGGGRGMGSESSLEKRIKAELLRQYAVLDTKATKLINDFETHAFNTINEMLFDSELKLQAESEKYGVKVEGVKPSTLLSDSTTTPGAPAAGGTTYSLEENNKTEGLRDAARRMWPLRNELDILNKKRDKLMVRQVSNNEGPMPRYLVTDQSQYDQLSQQITEKAEAYEILRVKNLAEYPLLAAFAGAGGAAELQQISQGGTGAADTVGGLITKQLENIEKVRNALGSGELNIWSVPTVVKGTKMHLAFMSGTIGAKLVDDQMRTIAVTDMLSQLAIGAVALALGLAAAIPTGGASMGVAAGVMAANIGTVAVSTYMLGETLRKYELAQAMNGTDPDKARAISQNEPSLFWLALEIVGTVFDVAQAARVFDQLVTMQRAVAALPAGVAGAADDVTTQTLRQAGNRIRQGVGDRLVSEARAGAGMASDASTAVRAAENAEDYLAAMRGQAGGNNVRWDHGRFPSAPRGSKWQLGDPIDMPNTRGGYPTYDTARKRYWKNRAHNEMQARTSGQAAQDAADVADPLRSMSDDELRRIANSGSAPVHPTTGRKMELEHSGVPQRVERWLKSIGFSSEQARRLADVSNPHALMEVEPLEHAFFDAEAWSFGRQRADIDGARWTGTQAADVRIDRPLFYMTDATLSQLLAEISSRSMNLQSNPQLRSLLLSEAQRRGIPTGNL